MIVQPIRRRDAQGLVARVYEEIDHDFFLAPPLALHSPSPSLLAAVWTAFREVFLCGEAPRAWKETIAAAVARANRCPFCVEAHTMFLHGLGAHAAALWLAAETDSPSPGGELAAIAEWASAIRAPGAPVLRQPPFRAAWAPELIGTAVAFQYVTAMATVFLDSTPIPRGFRWMSRTVRRIGGTVLARRLDRRPPPGRALTLLPEAPVSADLSWTAPNPTVAAAFGRLAAAADEAGARVLPAAARARVSAAVEGWRGDAPPWGGDWVERTLEGEPPLGTNSRDLSRLALVTALAPERLPPEEVRALVGRHGDQAVLDAAAWGAFTAARRVSAWMRGPY